MSATTDLLEQLVNGDKQVKIEHQGYRHAIHLTMDHKKPERRYPITVVSEEIQWVRKRLSGKALVALKGGDVIETFESYELVLDIWTGAVD
ncbi:hypothetical protein BJD55_gp054 [Gordonia phage Yvonnetastic]|uniref:Uncharacterized protein n=1 Tax=Gordonia phage Yvonnetastic TaxID=1821566 RepID=A0A142K9C9_9CAUD|nr:hypothetical protein BJD55_gp054 [Gordonia phage Yvonnetastic]AMS02712.1 hypothetical protein SEA_YVONNETASTIC_168 [Gordonia phage Yvonnetastic]